VRTIRSDFVAGLEFVRLRAGGKGLLKDLIVDLEKVRAAIDKLKSDGNELGPELFLQELKYRKPASGNVAQAVSVLEQLQSQPIAEPPQTPYNEPPRIAEELVIPIDLSWIGNSDRH
jgi:hypothetical protein